MAIELWSTDKLFSDSPDTGHPDCFCSRCKKVIPEEDMPLRMVPKGQNKEYRYCEACQEKHMGIKYSSNIEFDNSFVDPIDYPEYMDDDDDLDF